jgi:hypothetical protein
MQRFQSVGYVNSDPAGDLVRYSAVLNLCEELVDFVLQIIDEIQFKDLKKEDSG